LRLSLPRKSCATGPVPLPHNAGRGPRSPELSRPRHADLKTRTVHPRVVPATSHLPSANVDDRYRSKKNKIRSPSSAACSRSVEAAAADPGRIRFRRRSRRPTMLPVEGPIEDAAGPIPYLKGIFEPATFLRGAGGAGLARMLRIVGIPPSSPAEGRLIDDTHPLAERGFWSASATSYLWADGHHLRARLERRKTVHPGADRRDAGRPAGNCSASPMACPRERRQIWRRSADRT